jgi:hypothetical protein
MRIRFFRPLGLASALALGFVAPAQAIAANVTCSVHASLGDYKIELFRVGDRLPTATIARARIDGGKWVTFTNVPTGYWFVRATHADQTWITGQGAAGHITGWFPWWQTVPDCWVRP